MQVDLSGTDCRIIIFINIINKNPAKLNSGAFEVRLLGN